MVFQANLVFFRYSLVGPGKGGFHAPKVKVANSSSGNGMWFRTYNDIQPCNHFHDLYSGCGIKMWFLPMKHYGVPEFEVIF